MEVYDPMHPSEFPDPFQSCWAYDQLHFGCWMGSWCTNRFCVLLQANIRARGLECVSTSSHFGWERIMALPRCAWSQPQSVFSLVHAKAAFSVIHSSNVFVPLKTRNMTSTSSHSLALSLSCFSSWPPLLLLFPHCAFQISSIATARFEPLVPLQQLLQLFCRILLQNLVSQLTKNPLKCLGRGSRQMLLQSRCWNSWNCDSDQSTLTKKQVTETGAHAAWAMTLFDCHHPLLLLASPSPLLLILSLLLPVALPAVPKNTGFEQCFLLFGGFEFLISIPAYPVFLQFAAEIISSKPPKRGIQLRKLNLWPLGGFELMICRWFGLQARRTKHIFGAFLFVCF